MRHAGGRRRPRAALGQVLSGRNDLPAVRHRDRLPLSLGRCPTGSRLGGTRAADQLLWDSLGRLRLRVAEGCARLGSGRASAKPGPATGSVTPWLSLTHTITGSTL